MGLGFLFLILIYNNINVALSQLFVRSFRKRNLDLKYKTFFKKSVDKKYNLKAPSFLKKEHKTRYAPLYFI